MDDEHGSKVRLEAPEPAIDLVTVLEGATCVRDGTIAAGIQDTDGSLASLVRRGSVDTPHEDPMHPGGEPIWIAQGTKVTPGQDQGLLDRILSQVAVAEHELGDVEHMRDRLFGQCAERLPVALLRTLHQVPLHVRL